MAYDDQKKAAVLASLLEGQSVSKVARDYRIDRRTVQIWRDTAGIKSPPVSQEKRDEIGELVADALRGYLTAVSVLTERTQDADWFKKQPASDVAVLIGVLTDKAVRILEAVESAAPGEVDTASPPEAA